MVAVFTIVSGILGAVVGPPLLDRLGVTDRRTRGLAMGAVSAATHLDRPVPDALSVVGYNDIPVSSQLAVPLTTVRVPFDQIAATDRFAEATDDMVDAILTEAGRMTTEVLAPLNRGSDLQGAKLENGAVRSSPRTTGSGTSPVPVFATTGETISVVVRLSQPLEPLWLQFGPLLASS